MHALSERLRLAVRRRDRAAHDPRDVVAGRRDAFDRQVAKHGAESGSTQLPAGGAGADARFTP